MTKVCFVFLEIKVFWLLQIKNLISVPGSPSLYIICKCSWISVSWVPAVWRGGQVAPSFELGYSTPGFPLHVLPSRFPLPFSSLPLPYSLSLERTARTSSVMDGWRVSVKLLGSNWKVLKQPESRWAAVGARAAAELCRAPASWKLRSSLASTNLNQKAVRRMCQHPCFMEPQKVDLDQVARLC